MLEDQLTADLKSAMLAKDATKVTTLRGLKSVILYAKVAAGTRDEAMPDDQIITLFSKEAKKRQESADLYRQGGNEEKAEAELAEKAIIEAYLPKQMEEAELGAVIDEVIEQIKPDGPSAMGQVIGAVKGRTAGAADGAMIARMVKERLS